MVGRMKVKMLPFDSGVDFASACSSTARLISSLLPPTSVMYGIMLGFASTF